MTSLNTQTKYSFHQFSNFEPEKQNLLKEVIEGLKRPVKELPCKLFYDQDGSQIFDRICELEEYYLTRTETAIMRENIHSIVNCIGSRCMLLEYGSGSSEKTRFLLEQLPDLAAYVPVDISREHLKISSHKIAEKYPHIDVLPVCADYNETFEIPQCPKPVTRKVFFFPGSTIGNFHPSEAVSFLQGVAKVCGEDGGFLIGVDLKKNPQVLHQAYNDSQGVTAEFNLNILNRLNQELNANFQIEQFRHYAFYNVKLGRIEMHLVSSKNQIVILGNISFAFKEGETVWTESSYKYTCEEFKEIAIKAGFQIEKVWVDSHKLFSVQYLKKLKTCEL